MSDPAPPAMTRDAVAAFFAAGLKRERHELEQREALLAALLKHIETNPSLVDIVQFAHQVFEAEESAYLWLVGKNLLLNGRTPSQAMLDGDSAWVRQLLANIEYGMPA